MCLDRGYKDLGIFFALLNPKKVFEMLETLFGSSGKTEKKTPLQNLLEKSDGSDINPKESLFFSLLSISKEIKEVKDKDSKNSIQPAVLTLQAELKNDTKKLNFIFNNLTSKIKLQEAITNQEKFSKNEGISLKEILKSAKENNIDIKKIEVEESDTKGASKGFFIELDKDGKKIDEKRFIKPELEKIQTNAKDSKNIDDRPIEPKSEHKTVEPKSTIIEHTAKEPKEKLTLKDILTPKNLEIESNTKESSETPNIEKAKKSPKQSIKSDTKIDQVLQNEPQSKDIKEGIKSKKIEKIEQEVETKTKVKSEHDTAKEAAQKVETKPDEKALNKQDIKPDNKPQNPKAETKQELKIEPEKIVENEPKVIKEKTQKVETKPDEKVSNKQDIKVDDKPQNPKTETKQDVKIVPEKIKEPESKSQKEGTDRAELKAEDKIKNEKIEARDREVADKIHSAKIEDEKKSRVESNEKLERSETQKTKEEDSREIQKESKSNNQKEKDSENRESKDRGSRDEGSKSKQKNDTQDDLSIRGDSTVKNDFLNRVSEVRESIKYLSDRLKDEIDNYKSPFKRISLELNPRNLGSVDVTMVTRGNSLHITIGSNAQALMMLAQNAGDFRNNLLNLGFGNIVMNFSTGSDSGNREGNSGRGGYQGERNRNSLYATRESDKSEKRETLELIIPRYI